MAYLSRTVLALAFVAGVAAAPTASWAESSSKSESAKSADKSQSSSSSDFEENRRAHIQKSKENNEKKGAN